MDGKLTPEEQAELDGLNTSLNSAEQKELDELNGVSSSPKPTTSPQGAESGVKGSFIAPQAETTPYTSPSGTIVSDFGKATTSSLGTIKAVMPSEGSVNEKGSAAHITPQNIRAYEYAQKNTSDADKRLSHYKSSLNLTETDPTKIDSRWTSQKKQAQQYQLLKSERDALSLKSKDAIGKLKSDVDNIVKSVDLNKFISKDVDGVPYADATKIDEHTSKIAEYSGVPKDGYFNTMLRNELKAKTEWNIIEPDVNKNFDEAYQKKFGKSKNEYEAEKFGQAFTGDDAVVAKTKLQLDNIKAELTSEAKEKVKPLEIEYKAISDNLQAEAEKANNQAQQKIAALQQQLQQQVNSGAKSVENANKQLQQQQDAIVLEAKSTIETIDKQFQKNKKSYLENSNNIFLKQEQRFKRHQTEIIKQADLEISGKAKEFEKKYKQDPKYLEEVKTLYEESVSKVTQGNAALKKIYALTKPLGFHYIESAISSLGGTISGVSTSIGSRQHYSFYNRFA